MKLIAMMCVMLAACAVDGPKLAPDAVQWGVHDQEFFEPCDPAWTLDGRSPTACESACIVKPVEKPCSGDVHVPCNDHDACAKADDRGDVRDCPSTFVATDFAGRHLGCCLPRFVSSFPDKIIPSFYECPAQ
jgi:hypothetical protein